MIIRNERAQNSFTLSGAGISVRAGIPDFRSSEGLFKTLKRDNPREALASGKDLFDASVFNVSVMQHSRSSLLVHSLKRTVCSMIFNCLLFSTCF